VCIRRSYKRLLISLRVARPVLTTDDRLTDRQTDSSISYSSTVRAGLNKQLTLLVNITTVLKRLCFNCLRVHISQW